MQKPPTGTYAHREARGELWYLSPFREETEASFKINPRENVWYDFGEGKGGNVNDFMMHLNRHRDVSTALHELDSLIGQSRQGRDTHTLDLFAASRSQEPPVSKPASAFTLHKIQPRQNRALIQYLASRGITQEIAAAYVQELYYSRDDKHYFALAFANDRGGVELRNPYFKGVCGPKDITLLRTAESDTRTALVFEGFTDFLSYLTYRGISKPGTPVLVLNSVAMKERAIDAIKALEVRQVQLYFDHDEAGRVLTQYFEEQLPGVTVIDHSGVYAG